MKDKATNKEKRSREELINRFEGDLKESVKDLPTFLLEKIPDNYASLSKREQVKATKELFKRDNVVIKKPFNDSLLKRVEERIAIRDRKYLTSIINFYKSTSNLPVNFQKNDIKFSTHGFKVGNDIQFKENGLYKITLLGEVNANKDTNLIITLQDDNRLFRAGDKSQFTYVFLKEFKENDYLNLNIEVEDIKSKGFGGKDETILSLSLDNLSLTIEQIK